jgi:transposase
LLPPDVGEWLPADHLAWFVIDAVADVELSAFYAAYRSDGRGRAAYEPSLMVALVLYSFATQERSSRAIERHCRQDVAYGVIAGDLIPDHATIARLICRHERASADLFGEVLRLCDRAGLVSRLDRRHAHRRQRQPRGHCSSMRAVPVRPRGSSADRALRATRPAGSCPRWRRS